MFIHPHIFDFAKMQVYWLTICTAVVGWTFREGDLKRRFVKITLIHCFEFLSNSISSVVNYHNPENRPVNGICVANHTSPIDALVLMCDNCFSLVSCSMTYRILDLFLFQPNYYFL